MFLKLLICLSLSVSVLTAPYRYQEEELALLPQRGNAGQLSAPGGPFFLGPSLREEKKAPDSFESRNYYDDKQTFNGDEPNIKNFGNYHDEDTGSQSRSNDEVDNHHIPPAAFDESSTVESHTIKFESNNPDTFQQGSETFPSDIDAFKHKSQEEDKPITDLKEHDSPKDFTVDVSASAVSIDQASKTTAAVNISHHEHGPTEEGRVAETTFQGPTKYDDSPQGFRGEAALVEA